jgi:polysaccharide export outer membrane protein
MALTRLADEGRPRDSSFSMKNAVRARVPFALLMSSAAALAGCATLPTNGPTARQIEKGALRSAPPLQFSIVDIDPNVVEALRQEDSTLAGRVPTLSSLANEPSVDRVGVGDVLSINVFEVGVSLFSTRQVGDGFDPSAHTQVFPDLTVASDGMIDLPYANRLAVAGKSTHEIEQMIDHALSQKSQNPQAMVTIKKNLANGVFVSGDVGKPGRLELDLTRPRLLDAIASSGGSKYSSEDTVIRFSRLGKVVDERMGFVRAASADDLVLAPGDRIELVKRPRSYTVFGATQKASQVSFETGAVSLAEAIARSGGPNDATADAKAIFLFRYDGVPDSPDAAPPKVYRLNMLVPASYLLAQRLNMRDKDVLYFANAASNQPAKLISIINQLFSPFVAARAVAN